MAPNSHGGHWHFIENKGFFHYFLVFPKIVLHALCREISSFFIYISLFFYALLKKQRSAPGAAQKSPKYVGFSRIQAYPLMPKGEFAGSNSARVSRPSPVVYQRQSVGLKAKPVVSDCRICGVAGNAGPGT